jgi:methionine aminopeptidase
MIPIMNNTSLLKMITAGRLLAEIFEIVQPKVQIGTTTLELDSFLKKNLQLDV